MAHENQHWQQPKNNLPHGTNQPQAQDSWHQEEHSTWHQQTAWTQQHTWQQGQYYQGQQQDQQWYRPDGTLDLAPEDRIWAIFAHLSAIIATCISAGWLSFLGPLVVWLIKKENSSYVRSAAAQSFNFNLGLWVLNIVGWIFIFTIILIPIGFVILLVSFLMLLWHHIRAMLAASNNRLYRYPFQIRILS